MGVLLVFVELQVVAATVETEEAEGRFEHQSWC